MEGFELHVRVPLMVEYDLQVWVLCPAACKLQGWVLCQVAACKLQGRSCARWLRGINRSINWGWG